MFGSLLYAFGLVASYSSMDIWLYLYNMGMAVWLHIGTVMIAYNIRRRIDSGWSN